MYRVMKALARTCPGSFERCGRQEDWPVPESMEVLIAIGACFLIRRHLPTDGRNLHPDAVADTGA